MNPLDAAALVLLLALPLHWIVMRQFIREEDPAWLRERGVVIVSERAVVGERPIGSYKGRPVWERVTFKGMVYRFQRTVDRSQREHIGPRQLFLEPGLVYITD